MRFLRTLLAALVAAAALTLGLGSAAHADVDDFSFRSFHADYTLGLDAEGRSTLTTVETLVAVFPEHDQNRGIRRILVDRYDGHPTDIQVLSVTDEGGEPRHYELEDEELTIAGDAYVHGEQTYVITYTSHNVTRFYADTNADEFYWDVNGTEWAQRFGSVSATVTLEDGLQDRLSGDATAVWGTQGGTTPAEVARTAVGSSGTWTLRPRY